VKAQVLALLEERLRQTFTLDVERRPALPLPDQAFYQPRKRYRAEKLLDHLEQHVPLTYNRILGATEKDISTTKDPWPDWGIFGLAYLNQRPCIISTFRLRRGGVESRFRERLYKVAVHEVGHTLGLDHCPNKGCVMEDAKGTMRTVDEGTDVFCQSCRTRIQRHLR
jgi:archaemetzincin